MVRLIHSADWQLGARFSQFGNRGAQLREARLATLKRTLDLARQHEVDAFLIAGDLFEDNQVDDALVSGVVELFSAFGELPIYILPGNHDPFPGPNSFWQRPAFFRAPTHVHVLRQAGVLELSCEVFLWASPLQQKLSTADPESEVGRTGRHTSPGRPEDRCDSWRTGH